VRGYEVTYGENVTNGQLNVIDIEGVGESTRLNTSGVVVRNTDRHIWSTAVTTSELANSGSETVRLGGLTWQDTVTATRTGWRAVGGETTYRVTLSHDNQTRPLYHSAAVDAEPIVRRPACQPQRNRHRIHVGVDDEVAPLPGKNESTTLGRLTLRRQDSRLVAVNNRTQTAVRVANKVN